MTLNDAPLGSYSPEYDPDDWQKCCQKDIMVKANTGTIGNGNLWLFLRGEGPKGRLEGNDLSEGPDFKVTFTGGLRLCPWSLYKF